MAILVPGWQGVHVILIGTRSTAGCGLGENTFHEGLRINANYHTASRLCNHSLSRFSTRRICRPEATVSFVGITSREQIHLVENRFNPVGKLELHVCASVGSANNINTFSLELPVPEEYKENFDEGPSLETSKFSLYFSDSCIPTNESLLTLWTSSTCLTYACVSFNNIIMYIGGHLTMPRKGKK
jgi:hypothetical protein